jgi:hypothetical protein
MIKKGFFYEIFVVLTVRRLFFAGFFGFFKSSAPAFFCFSRRLTFGQRPSGVVKNFNLGRPAFFRSRVFRIGGPDDPRPASRFRPGEFMSTRAREPHELQNRVGDVVLALERGERRFDIRRDAHPRGTDVREHALDYRRGRFLFFVVSGWQRKFVLERDSSTPKKKNVSTEP